MHNFLRSIFLWSLCSYETKPCISSQLDVCNLYIKKEVWVDVGILAHWFSQEQPTTGVNKETFQTVAYIVNSLHSFFSLVLQNSSTAKR